MVPVLVFNYTACTLLRRRLVFDFQYQMTVLKKKGTNIKIWYIEFGIVPYLST